MTIHAATIVVESSTPAHQSTWTAHMLSETSSATASTASSTTASTTSPSDFHNFYGFNRNIPLTTPASASTGFSGGAIAGIVIGSILGGMLLVVATFLIRRSGYRAAARAASAPPSLPQHAAPTEPKYASPLSRRVRRVQSGLYFNHNPQELPGDQRPPTPPVQEAPGCTTSH